MPDIFSCTLDDLPLKLKYTWKISRNSSDHKHNFIVRIKTGSNTFLGEVAPNIRYQETPELIRSQFESIRDNLNKIKTEESLQAFLNEISLCNSLRFGIESSFIHYFAFTAGKSITQYLQIDPPPRELASSYTIPILPPENIGSFIKEHGLLRFDSLKLKVGKEGMLEMIKAIDTAYKGKIRIDANEAWEDPDSFLSLLTELKKYNIEFIEQPFPSDHAAAYLYLKNKCPYPVIADESITSNPDIRLISKHFDGINMKLMKAGGYRNGIKILQEARQNGLKTMVGCMVETTVGIFSAFNLCNEVNYIDLDGFFLVENEPFKQVSEDKGKLFYLT